MIGSALLLVLALAAYGYFFKGDFGRLKALEMMRPPGWRRRRYRIWIAKSCALFAAPAMIALLLLGRLDWIWSMPSVFLPLALSLGYPEPIFSEGIAIGLAGGSVIGGGWTLLRRRKGKPPAMLGDFGALLPQARDEAWLAAGSAIAAGVTEELYFRLLLPVLIAQLTGSVVAGFAASTILFALAHRYQKWLGVDRDRGDGGTVRLPLSSERAVMGGDAAARHH